MPSTTSSSIIRGGGGVLLSLRAPRSLPGHAEGRKTATAAEDTTKRERERERERRNKRERRPSRERLEAAARCRQAVRVFLTLAPTPSRYTTHDSRDAPHWQDRGIAFWRRKLPSLLRDCSSTTLGILKEGTHAEWHFFLFRALPGPLTSQDGEEGEPCREREREK